MRCIKSLLYLIFILPMACAVVPNDQQDSSDQEVISERFKNDYPSRQINAFIVDLYDALAQESGEALFSMWEIDSLLDRVIYHAPMLGVSTAIKIRNDLASNDIFLREMTRKLHQTFHGGTIAIAETNLEEKTIKLRISTEQSSSYVAFHLELVDGIYKIVDFYDYAFGIMISKKLGVIFQLAYSMTPLDQGPAKQFFNALNLYKSGDAQAALAILDGLPEYFLKPKELMAMYIEVAAAISEETLNEKLALADRYYRGDPLASYLLSNLYLANNDIPQTLVSLKQFIEVYGPDSEIYSAIANLYFAENDLSNALIYANQAIRVNPNDENAYWILVRVFARQGELSDSVLALQVLQSYFGYQFSPEYFYDDELFADIADEQVFQDWLNTL